MKPNEFKAWRKKLKLKQKDAAELLGLKKRMIQYYERGDREGRPVKIPLYVSLACYAVCEGVVDFDGTTPKRKNDGKDKSEGKDRGGTGKPEPERPAVPAIPEIKLAKG